jgi:hypothetical protein
MKVTPAEITGAGLFGYGPSGHGSAPKTGKMPAAFRLNLKGTVSGPPGLLRNDITHAVSATRVLAARQHLTIDPGGYTGAGLLAMDLLVTGVEPNRQDAGPLSTKPKGHRQWPAGAFSKRQHSCCPRHFRLGSIFNKPRREPRVRAFWPWTCGSRVCTKTGKMPTLSRLNLKGTISGPPGPYKE